MESFRFPLFKLLIAFPCCCFCFVCFPLYYWKRKSRSQVELLIAVLMQFAELLMACVRDHTVLEPR